MGMLLTAAPELSGAELKRETLQGHERYVQATEVRVAKEESDPGAFLYIDTLPEPRREDVLAKLQHGEVFVTRVETRDASGGEIAAPGGLIHHWLGIVLVPGASVRQVLDVVQDYNRHQDYYKPDVAASRLMSRHGDDFHVFLRFREKKVITVTLNTEHDVSYKQLDAAHWYSRSVSTRIQEVEDAGQPGEHELTVGHDGGYLWRINTYWRFEARDNGVYVQCESVSLTRDIPTGLGWLIGPFVTSIPRESLERTLGNTRAAVKKQ